MTAAYDCFETPLGPFSIAVDSSGALLASVFGGREALAHLLPGRDLVADAAAVEQARRQVEEYFEGRRTVFDLALAPRGSDFQHHVWRALGEIPYGCTTTYGALAATLASSARATGRANATNPICLVVPCHRVIGADGSLTGFAYGIEIKQRLLEHERSIAAIAR